MPEKNAKAATRFCEKYIFRRLAVVRERNTTAVSQKRARQRYACFRKAEWSISAID